MKCWGNYKFMPTTQKPIGTKRNPGWKLEQATIDIVVAARGALKLKGNADVIAHWAQSWQNQQAAARGEVPRVVDLPMVGGSFPEGMGTVTEKPVAVRVETPYQIERRQNLERLRAQLAEGSAGGAQANDAGAQPVGAEPIVVPFDVMVNGEKHRVIEFHGRRILEWIGPTSTVMKKNLTPQEVVIYWRDRVQ